MQLLLFPSISRCGLSPGEPTPVRGLEKQGSRFTCHSCDSSPLLASKEKDKGRDIPWDTLEGSIAIDGNIVSMWAQQ